MGELEPFEEVVKGVVWNTVPLTMEEVSCPKTKNCLRWRGVVGAPKERRYVRVAAVAPDALISPFNHSLDTCLRAITERVFLVKDGSGFKNPPRPKKGVFARTLQCAWDSLEPCLPTTAPVSHQQFVDHYKGRKKVCYQTALDDLRAGRGNLEEDSFVKAFIKFEKTDRTIKTDPVPRVISPRDPKYNIRVGRYLLPLEKRIFKSIRRMFKSESPVVIKGLNAEASANALRSKWDSFVDPVAVGLDASRFDQHVSFDALRWEHRVYARCFKGKHRERLLSLLRWQLVNRCSAEAPDGIVEYRVRGTRMSGDMNTSLGNCVLMCSMIYAYLKAKGVEGQLANNGDDCVVFMERCDLARFSEGLDEWFTSLGFTMAVEPAVDEFEQVEFCQTKPVFDGHGWVMCRNPSTAITKDSVMLKCWDSPKLFRGWLDAVGTGGISLTGGLPVFQSFYNSYVRSGKYRPIPKELLPWSFRTLSMGMNRKPMVVSPEARASFYFAYDVTPCEQIELEKYYDKLAIHGVPGEYQPRGVFL